MFEWANVIFTISICHFCKQCGYTENKHLQNYSTEPYMKMAKERFASNNNNLQALRYLIKYTDCADVQSSAGVLCGLSHLTALLSQLILLDKFN